MPLIVGKNRHSFILWFYSERIVHDQVELTFKPVMHLDSVNDAKLHGCKRLEVDKRVARHTKAFKLIEPFKPWLYFKTRVYGMALNKIEDYDYSITTEDKYGQTINVGSACLWIEYLKVKKGLSNTEEDILRAELCYRMLQKLGKI